MFRLLTSPLTTLVGVVALTAWSALGLEGLAAEKVDFQRQIRPLLIDRCFACHGHDAEHREGGLRLDQREAALRGGDSGVPAIVAGAPNRSELVRRILSTDDSERMPPPDSRKSLNDAEKDLLRRWVAEGAEYQPHWAFASPVRPSLPAVRNKAWPQNAIDRLILVRLETANLQPSPPADRATLLRRLSFDLTGLPPTPDEIDGLTADDSPDAYERVVDRLLASPRYGERQAQHWLDVVRFAETEGYEYDRHVPGAWRFRDYVINAFNTDKPFDRFVIEQIAGDEIDPQDHECLTASIFHRLGPVRRNAGNPEIALSRNEVLTERTDIIGTAFLGLSIGCARCHNHKLEPISQRDYYALQAYLAATEEHNISLASAAEQQAWEAETATIQREIDRLKEEMKRATLADKMRITAEIAALDAKLPPPLATIPATWNDQAKRTAIHVLRRGVWEDKGEAVGPRPPSVLLSSDPPELAADTSNPRTRLAEWIASPENPLTARVFVNRLWQQHFGTGLVSTANDFGLRGQPPSHPALLDWLAAELVESGWQSKPLQRRIVLSAVYRQSANLERGARNSERSVAPSSADPGNRLLRDFPRRRLSAEELRDAMLAVSGRLNLAAGGPSVMVPVDPQLVDLLYKPSQWEVPANRSQHDRRSVYLIAKRNLRLPFMETFDAPALLSSCSRREASTHAPQALEMLNGTLTNDLAAAFAHRLRRETSGTPDETVRRAFRLALSREPTPRERELSLNFLRDQPLEEFCLALFNLNDFAYVP